VNAVEIVHIVGTRISGAVGLASNGATGKELFMRRGELLKRDKLLKPDLLSEIVLLGSGVAILVALAMVVVVALTNAAAG